MMYLTFALMQYGQTLANLKNYFDLHLAFQLKHAKKMKDFAFYASMVDRMKEHFVKKPAAQAGAAAAATGAAPIIAAAASMPVMAWPRLP